MPKSTMKTLTEILDKIDIDLHCEPKWNPVWRESASYYTIRTWYNGEQVSECGSHFLNQALDMTRTTLAHTVKMGKIISGAA